MSSETRRCWYIFSQRRKCPGCLWRWVETAGPRFKTEIPPQAGLQRSAPPPRQSPAGEPYVRSFQEFLLGNDAVTSEQRCLEQRKWGGGGGEPLTSSAWERRDLGHSSPPKMSLGFKGSREAGHPQRPVSGKQGACWASYQLGERPLGAHLSSAKTDLSPRESWWERPQGNPVPVSGARPSQPSGVQNGLWGPEALRHFMGHFLHKKILTVIFYGCVRIKKNGSVFYIKTFP